MEMAAEEYHSSCQPNKNRWSYNCFGEREKCRSAGISQYLKNYLGSVASETMVFN